MSFERACCYAALILQDEGLEITADKLQTILDAANVQVDSIWPSIFAKALQTTDVASLLTSIGSAPAPTGAVQQSSGAAAAAEEVQEEVAAKEESDDDMGFGLFD